MASPRRRRAPRLPAGAAGLLPPHQEFLDLPARYGRRCLIPLATARIRLAGSALYPAYRAPVRAYRAALRAWIALGGARLTHGVITTRGDDWPLGDLLRPELPTLATAALFVPKPREPRFTVQLLDRHGRTLAYAKYAATAPARGLLANEARMVASIPAGLGPRLLRLSSLLQGDVLVQTPLPGRPYAPASRLDAAQRRLLGRLVRPGRTYVASEHPFVKRLYREIPEHRPLVESLVAELGDAEWPVAWMHGNFSFQNLFRWRGECLALDWEVGAEDGLPYLDAAEWFRSVAAANPRKDPRVARPWVAGRLAAYLPDDRKRLAPTLASLSAVSSLAPWCAHGEAHPRWVTAFLQGPDSRER